MIENWLSVFPDDPDFIGCCDDIQPAQR